MRSVLVFGFKLNSFRCVVRSKVGRRAGQLPPTRLALNLARSPAVAATQPLAFSREMGGFLFETPDS